jgi:hypothetical protein
MKYLRRSLRFSLATLLLVCAFAGALMGCWTQREPWRRCMDFPSAGPRVSSQTINDYIAFDSSGDKLAVYQSGGGVRVFDLIAQKCLWAREYTQSLFLTTLQFDDTTQELALFNHLRVGDYSGLLVQRLALIDGNDHARSELIRNDGTLAAPQPYFFSREGLTPRDPRHRVDPVLSFNDTTGMCLVSYTADGKELAAPAGFYTSSKPICRISLRNQSYTIDTGIPIVATRYSPDSQYLAMLHKDGAVSVWLRQHSFGPWGWLELPMFWIAASSGLALLVRLGMRILSRSRTRAKLMPDLSPPQFPDPFRPRDCSTASHSSAALPQRGGATAFDIATP